VGAKHDLLNRRTAAVRVILLAGSLATAGYAQPAFEAASVKPSAPPQTSVPQPSGCRGGPGTPEPGLWRCNNMPLSNLLMWAYGLKRYQLTTQAWMDSSRFDIMAKIPQGIAKEQLVLMEQNLLTERFRLMLHHEQKEMPIYELTVAKSGPKLKEAVDRPPSDQAAAPRIRGLDQYGCPIQPVGWGGTAATKDRRMLGAPRGSTDDLSSSLSSYLSTPVVNATELVGKYEFVLCWVPDRAADSDTGPTLVDALREQLGLKLESKRGSIDIVVIDHAERTPIEN
jgi:uncharacterized protein (TIGR03435 family)